MKVFLRCFAAFIMVISIILGYISVNTFQSSTAIDDIGISMVRLLYEYESITDVYNREGQIKSLCSPDVWETINFDNTAHFAGTWDRTRNIPTVVRVVFTRPGLVVYALENDFVVPRDLWCFEYRIENGVFSEVREYQLASMRRDKEGGLF